MFPESTRCRRSDIGNFGQKNQRVSCKLWKIKSLTMKLTANHFAHLSRLTNWCIVTWLLLRLDVHHAAYYWWSPQSWTILPWNEFLGRVWRGKSLVVWQARTGLIFHAVGFAVEQEQRQETKKLQTQAILHDVESLGWDELEMFRASKQGSCLLSSFSLLCLPLAQLKLKWGSQWLYGGGMPCSVTGEVFLLLKGTISSVPYIPPFARNSFGLFGLSIFICEYFVLIFFWTFVSLFIFFFCPSTFWLLLHFTHTGTKFSQLLQNSPFHSLHSVWKQSRAVYIPASPRLGKEYGHMPVLINRELLVTA